MASIIDTDKLKSLLKANRITVREFGESMFSESNFKIQESRASRLLHNKMKMRPEYIKQISNLLKVEASEFTVKN
jgi:hypothetical protein